MAKQQEISNLPGFYWINKKNPFGIETTTRRAYNPSSGENITVREAQTRQHGGVSYEKRKKGIVSKTVDKFQEVVTGRKRYSPEEIQGFTRSDPKSLSKYQRELRNTHIRQTAQERYDVAKRMGIDISKETGIKPDRVQKIVSGEKFRGYKSTDAEKIASVFDDRPIRPNEMAEYLGVSVRDLPESYRGRGVDMSTTRYVPGIGFVSKRGNVHLHVVKLTSVETGKSRYKFYSNEGLRTLESELEQGSDSEYDFIQQIRFEVAV